MRKQKRVKGVLLALLTLALAIPVGIGAMAVTGKAAETESVITYRGRSLRIDTQGSAKTSLRFGYTIELPEGATPAPSENGTEWISWDYTTDGKDPEDSSVQANKKETKAVSVVKNEDGSYTANLVITGIPSHYYWRIFYAKMKVQYLESGEVKTKTDDWRCTTIQEVVAAIKDAGDQGNLDKNPTYQTDRKYAEELEEEIDSYEARVGDRGYHALPDAIENAKTGSTVSVWQKASVTKAITIDKDITLENIYGTPARVEDSRASKDTSMITVAPNGTLTIAGNGLVIYGNIQAEGSITLEKGTVRGEVALSDKNDGISLRAGSGVKILTDENGEGGLTGAHEEGAERTAPLLVLMDDTQIPEIYISETKADTVVMNISDALITTAGGIAGIQKATKEKQLTCTAKAQLMWGPYGAQDKTVTIQDSTEHIHCVCGGNVLPIAHCGTGHWDIIYDELESTTKAHVGGNYYLADDITIGDIGGNVGYYDMQQAKKDINLCLNGHTLTGTGTKRIIYAGKSSTGDYMLNVTGVCPATKDPSTAVTGDGSISYGTLKKKGSANGAESGLGGCIYVTPTANSEVRLYNVYLDGSEGVCNRTDGEAGGTLYNSTSTELKGIFNCLISKTQGTCPGAYNKNKGELPYISTGGTVSLYEFPSQQ